MFDWSKRHIATHTQPWSRTRYESLNVKSNSTQGLFNNGGRQIWCSQAEEVMIVLQ